MISEIGQKNITKFPYHDLSLTRIMSRINYLYVRGIIFSLSFSFVFTASVSRPSKGQNTTQDSPPKPWIPFD